MIPKRKARQRAEQKARCPACGKVNFADRASATAAAEQARARDPRATTMSAYRCPKNHWHIGRSHAFEPLENFEKVKPCKTT